MHAPPDGGRRVERAGGRLLDQPQLSLPLRLVQPLGRRRPGPDRGVRGRSASVRGTWRLEGALKRLPARIAGSGATPGRQGRGCENTLGAMPHQALGEGGRSRHGRCAPFGNGRAWPRGRRTSRARRITRPPPCESPNRKTVKRPPASFSRSSAAQVGALGHRPTRLRRIAALRALPPCLSSQPSRLPNPLPGRISGSRLEQRRANRSVSTVGRPTGRTIHNRHYVAGGDQASTGWRSCRARSASAGFRRTRPSSLPVRPVSPPRTSPPRTVRRVSSATASRAVRQGWLPTRYWPGASLPLVGTKGLTRGFPLRSPTTPSLTLGVRGPRLAPSAYRRAAHQPDSLDPAEKDPAWSG